MKEYIFDQGKFGNYSYKLFSNEHSVNVLIVWRGKEILDDESNIVLERYDEKDDSNLFNILSAIKEFYEIGYNEAKEEFDT